jgi:hypothetical protein
MPCGIKMEVVQGINFLQVVNTTLYAITMEFSNNFSLENHNFYILTSSSSSFLELFYKKIANVRKILNMTFTWFTFILGSSTLYHVGYRYRLEYTLDSHKSLGFLFSFFSSFTKVTKSIPVFDLFLHSWIAPKCKFHLTYPCTCLELFPRGQSMQEHDLAKYEWSLFIEWKWV